MKEMKENVEYAVKKFEDGFMRLKQGVLLAEDDLGKDGVIQRYEFTFELLWKALKIFLEYQGIEVKTPRESLKQGFRINLLDEEDVYLDMLEDRNITSHIYHQETSEEIFERIKTIYLQAMERVSSRLRESMPLTDN
ncbi:MAG: HI0074 family nucleotidyltransferase substrate-binding subunit [bacterium]|nr:HI0074 family nucleotidyltransferase substrate-binding subunit [bacterium]